MTFTIPIYIEESRAEQSSAPLFLARPLFFPEPQAKGEKLNRVTARLITDLRKHLQAQALEMATRRSPLKILDREPREVMERIQETMRRIEREIEPWEPQGPIRTDEIQPLHRRYFAVREQLRRVQVKCRRLEERLTRARKPSLGDHSRSRLRRGRNIVKHVAPGDEGMDGFKDVFSIQELEEYVSHLTPPAASGDDDACDDLEEILREMAFVRTMTEASADGSSDRALLCVRTFQHEMLEAIFGSWTLELRKAWTNAFRKLWGFEAKDITKSRFGCISLEGPNAVAVAKIEEGMGIHLRLGPDTMDVRESWAVPLAIDADPAAVLKAIECEMDEPGLSGTVIILDFQCRRPPADDARLQTEPVDRACPPTAVLGGAPRRNREGRAGSVRCVPERLRRGTADRPLWAADHFSQCDPDHDLEPWRDEPWFARVCGTSARIRGRGDVVFSA